MKDNLILTKCIDILFYILITLVITSLFNFFFKKVKYCNNLYNIYTSLMILYTFIIPLNHIIKFVNITLDIYITLIILYYISTLFKSTEKNILINDKLTPREIIELCDKYHSDYEDDVYDDLSETNQVINYSFKKNNNIKYNVSKILSHKGHGRNLFFYVTWEGYSHDDNTYEPLKNLKDCTVLHNYVRKNKDLYYLKRKLGIY